MALQIVRLLEPEICLDCRFAMMAEVEKQDGTEKRMLFCRRRDCDNWIFSGTEPVSKVHVDGELEART